MHTVGFNGAAVNGIDVDDNNNGSGAGFVIFSENGTSIGSISRVAQTSAVAYNTTCDVRLKVDLGVASKPIYLKNLIVHDFKWKSGGVQSRGLFAQEAYMVAPLSVAVGKDDLAENGNLVRPWGIDNSTFVPDLIVGWQEHEARILTLETRMKELEDGKNPQLVDHPSA